MKSKTKAILAFTAVFILAFVSGFLVSRSFGDWHHGNRNHDRSGSWDRGESPGEEMRRRMEDRISGFLDLDENQRERFFDSFESYHNQIRQTMRERREAENQLLRESYREFREDISPVLDSLQLQKMDSRFHPDSVRQHRMRNTYRDRERDR